MKIKRKQMVMLVLLAVFAALLVVTIITGGKETNGEYTSIAYATIFSLLPPVIAIGLALLQKKYIHHFLQESLQVHCCILMETWKQ